MITMKKALKISRLLRDPEFRAGIEFAYLQLDDARQFYLRGPMPRMLDYNLRAKTAVERLRDVMGED